MCVGGEKADMSKAQRQPRAVQSDSRYWYEAASRGGRPRPSGEPSVGGCPSEGLDALDIGGVGQ